MRARWLIAPVAALALAFAPAADAAPAVFHVNDTADFGLAEHGELCGQAKGPLEHLCTLRAALEAARTFDGIPSGADGILITVDYGYYTLSSGHPLPVGDVLGEACRGAGGAKVACPITIDGGLPERTTLDGAETTGLLRIQQGAGPVTIDGITLTHSLAAGGALEDDEGPSVTVRRSRFVQNGGEGSNGGAAVQVHRAAMTISESALEGNHAQRAGAIEVRGGELTVVDSSLTGNSAPLGGAALGALEGAQVTFLDTTVAGNAAPATGAVAAASGTDVAVRFSTLAGGSAPALTATGAQGVLLEGSILTAAAPAISCDGALPVVVSGPSILHGGASGCAVAGSTPSTADPLLGAPMPWGPVTVLPLLAGSPALNAGGASCPASSVEGGPADERGVPRPLGSGCDLGAFESAADAAVSLAFKPAAPAAGSPLTLSATVTAAGKDALSGVTMTIPLPPLANLVDAPDGCVAAFGEAPALTCPLGAMPAGSSRTVNVQLRPLAAETLQLGASAQSEQADFLPGDDAASLAVPVGVAAPTNPVATLLSRTLRVNRHGNALLRLRCIAAGAGTPCITNIALYPLHGRIAARPTPTPRVLALARTTFGAGRVVTVQVHLSKKARRAIHLRRRARARLVLGTGAAPVRRSVQVVTLVRTR